MEKNVGDFEAVARGVVGGGLLALGVSQRNPVWLGLSAIFFVTAFARRCPVNAAFNIDSYSGEKAHFGRGRGGLRSVPTIH